MPYVLSGVSCFNNADAGNGILPSGRCIRSIECASGGTEAERRFQYLSFRYTPALVHGKDNIVAGKNKAR